MDAMISQVSDNFREERDGREGKASTPSALSVLFLHSDQAFEGGKGREDACGTKKESDQMIVSLSFCWES